MRLQSCVASFAAMFFVFAGSAHAVNKCSGADGKVVFQDAPCAGKGQQIEVKPASGAGVPGLASTAPKTASAPAVGAASTEAQRLEGLVAASQRARRAQDLRDRLLPEVEVARSRHRIGCEQKQKDLASQQYAYVQNMYGKTHAAQIASEMAATAASCETKDRELKEALDALLQECGFLKCRG